MKMEMDRNDAFHGFVIKPCSFRVCSGAPINTYFRNKFFKLLLLPEEASSHVSNLMVKACDFIYPTISSLGVDPPKKKSL